MRMDEWNDDTKEKYKDELISMLTDVKRQEEIRAIMVPSARKRFSWTKVAKGWIESFEK